MSAKQHDIIILGQDDDGRFIFYLNDKVNRLKGTREEIQGLADYKRADIEWMIVPNTNPPAKSDSPL